MWSSNHYPYKVYYDSLSELYEERIMKFSGNRVLWDGSFVVGVKSYAMSEYTINVWLGMELLTYGFA